MSGALVSFVLPCFNSEQYLQETIDAIRLQTYTHWECIAIDDGSSDRTFSILQAAAQQDARFNIISRENRGLIASLNEGIAAAQGEWIARIDADDLCTPDRLVKQLDYCTANQIDLCGSWVGFIGDRNGEWHTPISDAEIRLALLFNTPIAHPSILARTALLKANPYPDDAPHAEDYALWCQIAATSSARFANLPEVLLHYRTHPGQVTQAKKAALLITAQRVREQYARRALPLALQPLAAEFAKLAEPTRILTHAEWLWMVDFFNQLIALCPESRGALGEMWLDTLQRSRGVNALDFPRALKLAMQMPPPKAERKKMLKQSLRLAMSDYIWRKIKP